MCLVGPGCSEGGEEADPEQLWQMEWGCWGGRRRLRWGGGSWEEGCVGVRVRPWTRKGEWQGLPTWRRDHGHHGSERGW